MSVLSSLLGVGRPQQLAGPMQTTAFPEELAPYYKDILSKSQALYEDRTKEGFQPYQGPTMAEFTPEQQQAFTGIAGLQGTQAPKFAEAEQLTRQAATAIGSEDIEQFMNPYQQAVVDIEKREAQKQFEQKTLPSIRAAQVAQGSFGGTRGSLLEAQTLEGQNRLLSDIQSRGSKQAYEQALQMAQAQKAREGQAGAQLAVMAPQAFKAQLGELGAVQTVGEEKQRQAQTALNEAYKQFLDERQFPQQSLAQYQGVVQAQPASQMLESVQYAPPGPSTSQQLLGGLGTLVGTYGAFGGFSPGGVFGNRTAKTGGGIGELPVIKKGNGGGFFSNLFNRKKPNINIDPTGSLDYGYKYAGGAQQPDLDMDMKNPNVDVNTLPDDVFQSRYGITKGDYKMNIFKQKASDTKDSAVDSAKDLYRNLTKKFRRSSYVFEGDPATEGGDIIRSQANVSYPDATEAEKNVNRTPFQKDVNMLKQIAIEALGEGLDAADIAAKYGTRTANAVMRYFGKGDVETMLGGKKYTFDEKGIGRKTISKALNIPELAEDRSLNELVSKTRSDTQEGIIPYLNLLADKGYDFVENEVNKITSSNASKEVKDKAQNYLEKNKEKLKKIKKDSSNLKEEESAIVEKVTLDGQKVITNVKPNVVNKKEEKIVKNKKDKVDKLSQELSKNPKDKKKASELSSARQRYLDELKKQKEYLGKQQGNIDDAKRKSMFEFLAKVSSRYGKGENLSDAAAGELDGAMSRTRQLDQASLDLKGKQREAELGALKEDVNIEEKKAAAAVEAGKESTRRKEKAFDQFIKIYGIDTKAKTEGNKRASLAGFNDFKSYLGNNKDSYEKKLKELSPDGKKQFIKESGIKGINLNNFDSAVEKFSSNLDDGLIYSYMKNDLDGGNTINSPGGMEKLYADNFAKIWRTTRGTFKEGKKIFGFTLPGKIE